jgi:hypothetical protein
MKDIDIITYDEKCYNGGMKNKWWEYVLLKPWWKECNNIFNHAFFLYREVDERRSFLLVGMRIFLAFLECISLKTIYQSYYKSINVQCFEANRYKAVEIYVFIWFLTEILLFKYIGNIPLCLIIFLLLWRLTDIFQSIFSIGILSEDPSPSSIPRMLILLLIGLTETAIIYGVFYYINKDMFVLINGETLYSKSQSLYHSVVTLTTIGSDFSPVSCVGYTIVYSQIAFSVLFLIVVIQRIVSLFKN